MSWKPTFTPTQWTSSSPASAARLFPCGVSPSEAEKSASPASGIEVDFSGEYNTLIVVHKDRIGMAAHITSCLSQGMVNIAFMRLFREAKGDTAYSIVEFDGELPEDTRQRILEKEDVENVMVIDVKEGL